MSGGLFQRLREGRSGNEHVWDNECDGEALREIYLSSTDDIVATAKQLRDAGIIAAEHNAMGPILDMLEKLDNQIAWRLNSLESGHWRDGLVDIRRQLRKLDASQADETGEL